MITDEKILEISKQIRKLFDCDAPKETKIAEIIRNWLEENGLTATKQRRMIC